MIEQLYSRLHAMANSSGVQPLSVNNGGMLVPQTEGLRESPNGHFRGFSEATFLPNSVKVMF